MQIKLALILPGLYYPVAERLPYTAPKRVFLGDNPLVLYQSTTNSSQYFVHSDVCPHLGAQLSSGVRQDDGIVCPYHGFVFRKGRFCGIQGSACSGRGGKQVLDLLEVFTDKETIYAGFPLQSPSHKIPPPFYPPEWSNSSFRVVSGSVMLPVSQQLLTENLVDMTHISFIHSFGNPRLPLAHDITNQELSSYSGRTTFKYSPRPGTLSSFLGGGRPDPEVYVENEFYLPSTTITRVTVGKDIKTVLTRTQPTGDNSCKLYWYLIRNFYTHPSFDSAIRFMMEKTIAEDAYILSRVYTGTDIKNKLTLPNIRYDVSIHKYRQVIQRYKESIGLDLESETENDKLFRYLRATTEGPQE